MRKRQIAALVFALTMSILLAAGCNCGGDYTPASPVTDPYVQIGYSEFCDRAEELLVVENYLRLVGFESNYVDHKRGTSLSAVIDMSVSSDVRLDVRYSDPSGKLRLSLGDGRLSVALSKGGSDKKDSMGVKNTLGELTSELDKVGEGTSPVEYLVAMLKDELSVSGSLIDADEAEKILGKCTFKYCEGEDKDEYMICHETAEAYADGYDVYISFEASDGCIGSLDGFVIREGGKVEFSFKRRTASAPVELPDEVYEGELLDDFEELYENKAVTEKDFFGEWKCEGYTLVIGSDGGKLTSPNGETELTLDGVMSNYLTLLSDDDVYIAHLTDGDLELYLPDDEILILKK